MLCGFHIWSLKGLDTVSESLERNQGFLILLASTCSVRRSLEVEVGDSERQWHTLDNACRSLSPKPYLPTYNRQSFTRLRQSMTHRGWQLKKGFKPDDTNQPRYPAECACHPFCHIHCAMNAGYPATDTQREVRGSQQACWGAVT